jgi:hypothetical protein
VPRNRYRAFLFWAQRQDVIDEEILFTTIADCRPFAEAIMEVEGLEVIQLELKYCERCGGLWLRLRGVQEVYCAPCVVEMLELPAPRRVASRPRLPVNHKIEIKAKPAALRVICADGGTA